MTTDPMPPRQSIPVLDAPAATAHVALAHGHTEDLPAVVYVWRLLRNRSYPVSHHDPSTVLTDRLVATDLEIAGRLATS